METYGATLSILRFLKATFRNKFKVRLNLNIHFDVGHSST